MLITDLRFLANYGDASIPEERTATCKRRVPTCHRLRFAFGGIAGLAICTSLAGELQFDRWETLYLTYSISLHLRRSRCTRLELDMPRQLGTIPSRRHMPNRQLMPSRNVAEARRRTASRDSQLHLQPLKVNSLMARSCIACAGPHPLRSINRVSPHYNRLVSPFRPCRAQKDSTRPVHRPPPSVKVLHTTPFPAGLAGRGVGCTMPQHARKVIIVDCYSCDDARSSRGFLSIHKSPLSHLSHTFVLPRA